MVTNATKIKHRALHSGRVIFITEKRPDGVNVVRCNSCGKVLGVK